MKLPIALLALTAVPGMCLAQASTPSSGQPAGVRSAPLPAVLSAAKSIFLANAGDQENADCLRAYNNFYSGLDQLHRFTLVADPAQADLIVELHYEIDLGASLISEGGRKGARQFRVALIEPHTHTLVWSLTEHTNYAVLQANRNRNLDTAVAALVTDFATLVSDQPVAPNNKSKAPR